MFWGIAGQISERAPALAAPKTDDFEVFNAENSPSRFFRIPFMAVSYTHLTLPTKRIV